MSRIRAKYDEEFKKNAVKLSHASPKGVKQVEKDLGINKNMLYRWCAKYTADGDKTRCATLEEENNWDCISPIFKFSADVRKIVYTTNSIESLHSTFRRLNAKRSVFPSDTSLLKALYLSTFEAAKKWTMPLKNWSKIYGEFSIMYEGRIG